MYLERKLSAWIQHRVGPNRVGPFGLLQPIVDVVKLLLKEDIIPDAADKRFHFLAPLISLATAVAVFGLIPFGNYILLGDTKIYLAVVPNINVGLLLVLAISSVAVYGVTLAGWSSNNKYSLLGGLRSASQMISYELSMGLSLIGVIMLHSTVNINDIVVGQGGFMNVAGIEIPVPNWNIFYQPFAWILFFVASLAETNRAPFDLPEAEPELVGGFHTEYSGMKFGIFFLAEYAHVMAASAMNATLFFGGWQLPPMMQEIIGLPDGSPLIALLQLGTFTAKMLLFICIFVWIRWSLPRFRYDQLMHLGWKIMLPLALLNILVTGLLML